MKALGLVVSDKKIFENCILKNYFLTPWPTYATNWNGLNNFDRGPPDIIPVKFGQNPNKGCSRKNGVGGCNWNQLKLGVGGCFLEYLYELYYKKR